MKHNVWTDEEIGRLFSYHNNHNPNYFSAGAGRKVLRCVKPYLNSVKNVLDYGCGLGYMSDYLMEAGYNTTAMDFTHASVDEVNKKFSGRKNWNGGFYYADLINYVTGGGGREIEEGEKDNKKFDAIFILEVIEHLSDYYLDELMKNLKILCKKGGRVVITTPNKEDLQKGMLYCPFCDTEFHYVQHLRTWSAETLTELLNSNNFSVKFISEVAVEELFSPTVKIKNILKRNWRKLHGITVPKYPPNLICVAQYDG